MALYTYFCYVLGYDTKLHPVVRGSNSGGLKNGDLLLLLMYYHYYMTQDFLLSSYVVDKKHRINTM